MYKSLEPWAQIPIIYRKYKGRSSWGDPEFEDDDEIKGQIVLEDKNITMPDGTNVVSGTTFYLDAQYKIKQYDQLVDPDGTAHNIIKTSAWYDTGNVSIRVAYA